MKPRKRGFKPSNKMKFAYIENNPDLGNDFFGIVPENSKGRWDLFLLFDLFLNRPIRNREWDKEKKEWIDYPTFIEELEKRGYDPKTIYFEIEKKNEEHNE